MNIGVWGLVLASVAGTARGEDCYQLNDPAGPVARLTLCATEAEADVTLRLFDGAEVTWVAAQPGHIEVVDGAERVFSQFAMTQVERYAVPIADGGVRAVRIGGHDYTLRAQGRKPERYFASVASQDRAPGAFATQAENAAVLADLLPATVGDRERLVAAIRQDAVLAAGLAHWASLTIEAQVPLLQQLFALEWQTFGIQRPELVIGPDVTPGAAFFEFDVTSPGLGKILLNTTALAEDENPYTGLLLLVHETRHAAQFQRAFGAEQTAVTRAFRAAFEAQSALSGQLVFADFCTLLNEYEAFQFANDVVGVLTDWHVDTLGMGTYASQFDEHGHLRVDLARIMAETAPSEVVKVFNAAETAQYELLRSLR